MHDERARRQWDRPVVEDDLAASHVLDVSQANDVLDGAEQIELPCAEGGGLGHRGNDVPVDPKHHAGRFEAQEEIVERLGVGGRRHGVRSKPERHRRIGLDDGAIEHPGVTRAHPDDAVRLHAVRQQPHDPVGGGLAGTDDHVAVRRRGPTWRAR